MSQYIRPFAAFGAGMLGDRLNSSKVMIIGQILSLVGIVGILLTPVSFSIWFILIASVFIYVSMYMTQSMHFALMEETNFPPEANGTVIDLVCCIGYLPEAFSPFLAGVILDKYTGLEGYRIFFTVLLITTAVGILFTMIWMRRTKEKRAELLEQNKEKRKEKLAHKAEAV